MKKTLVIIVVCLPLLLGARCFLFGPAELETVATPTISPAGGDYTTTQNVTISCATSEATIYYTTNGEDPTASSNQYADAISVNQTTTVKAIAVKSGMTDSNIASAVYTITVAPSIVGTWLQNQTHQSYFDNPPVTVSKTVVGTMIMSADGTVTFTGTNQWEWEGAPSTIEASGTYVYDEEAGTIVISFSDLVVGGSSMGPGVYTYNCTVTETTMTHTAPFVEAYAPAEPLIFTRQ